MRLPSCSRHINVSLVARPAPTFSELRSLVTPTVINSVQLFQPFPVFLFLYVPSRNVSKGACTDSEPMAHFRPCLSPFRSIGFCQCLCYSSRMHPSDPRTSFQTFVMSLLILQHPLIRLFYLGKYPLEKLKSPIPRLH